MILLYSANYRLMEEPYIEEDGGTHAQATSVEGNEHDVSGLDPSSLDWGPRVEGR